MHVTNREVPWEARIRFSYVEADDIVVLDVEPEGNEPSTAVLRKVLKSLAENINLLYQPALTLTHKGKKASASFLKKEAKDFLYFVSRLLIKSGAVAKPGSEANE